MSELTQENADTVRVSFPGVTNEQASVLLWNCTAYPACDYDHLRGQLEESYYCSGGDVSVALAIADMETTRAMCEIAADNLRQANSIRSPSDASS